MENPFSYQLLILTQAMTFGKTVHYFLEDYIEEVFTSHVHFLEYIFLFFIPNVLWVVFPLLSIFVIFQLMKQYHENETKNTKNE
jgi:hypothetical protein